MTLITHIVPTFDPLTHRQAATYTDVPDPANDRIVRTYGVEPIPLDEVKALRKAEVDAVASSMLEDIDAKSVRPLRATLAGTATSDDAARLAALEADAVAVRTHRAGLIAAIDNAADLKEAEAIDIKAGWPG